VLYVVVLTSLDVELFIDTARFPMNTDSWVIVGVPALVRLTLTQ